MPVGNVRKGKSTVTPLRAAGKRARASAVIASRRLTRNEAGAEHPITIRVRTPVRTVDGLAVCAFEIAGLPEPYRQNAIGVDSMQALLLALSAITNTLRPHRADLTWGKWQGNDGMPMAITFDDDTNAQLRGDIEAAVRRNERRVARFNAAKARELGIDLAALTRKPPPPK